MMSNLRSDNGNSSGTALDGSVRHAWRVRWAHVLRDVAMIALLSSLGLIVLGLVQPGKPTGVFSFIISILGFAISGHLARVNRWQHLTWVALTLYVWFWIRVWLFGPHPEHWLAVAAAGIVEFAAIMFFGGKLSYYLDGIRRV